MSQLTGRLEKWALWCHEKNLKAELQKDLYAAAERIAQQELDQKVERGLRERIVELEARLDAAIVKYEDLLLRVRLAAKKRGIDEALGGDDA